MTTSGTLNCQSNNIERYDRPQAPEGVVDWVNQFIVINLDQAATHIDIGSCQSMNTKFSFEVPNPHVYECPSPGPNQPTSDDRPQKYQ